MYLGKVVKVRGVISADVTRGKNMKKGIEEGGYVREKRRKRKEQRRQGERKRG
jgi:hypothetical protein